MLGFLGTGSAFNTKLGNNSAYLRDGNNLILIDCGGMIFHRLQECKLLEEVEQVSVIITHTHPDHIGSLGDVIFYVYYILHKTVTIHFPQKELIQAVLRSVAVGDEMYEVIEDKKCSVNEHVELEFVQTKHVDGMAAYGFYLTRWDETIYYSGDSRELDCVVVEKLISGVINKVYHDTCGLEYEGNNHTSFSQIKAKVPREVRGKFYCMHLDGHVSEEEIRREGFKVAVVQEKI